MHRRNHRTRNPSSPVDPPLLLFSLPREGPHARVLDRQQHFFFSLVWVRRVRFPLAESFLDFLLILLLLLDPCLFGREPVLLNADSRCLRARRPCRVRVHVIGALEAFYF